MKHVPDVLGSLVCEEVGPICLGPKSVTLKKKKRSGKEKQREEERKKNTYTQISSTSQSRFICGLIELKFGEEIQNSSNYNLNGEDQILNSRIGVTAREQ